MLDVSAVVACDAELEAVVGSRPGAVMLKSIRFLFESTGQVWWCVLRQLVEFYASFIEASQTAKH